MARYPGDEIIPTSKTIEGRHCQRVDLDQPYWLINPALARRAIRAAGGWYRSISGSAYWVEKPDRAHLALNVAMDPEGTRDRIEYLRADLPETAEEIEDLENLLQRIHGGTRSWQSSGPST